jgi:predicted amidohydrolase
MTLTIAAAQSASIAGDVAQNVARHAQFGELAAKHDVKLLVFPELSLTGYELAIARSHILRPDAPELEPLRRLARDAQMTMVAGAPLAGENGQLRIGALIFRPDGSLRTHTKEFLHGSEDEVFTSGPGGPLLQIEDASVGLAICADITHPEHAARARARGAHVYASGALISEKGYAGDTAFLSQYAREHGMAVLMANYSGTSGGWISAGKSVIFSEDGTVVAASTGAEEELIIASKQAGKWNGTVLGASQPSHATFNRANAGS